MSKSSTKDGDPHDGLVGQVRASLRHRPVHDLWRRARVLPTARRHARELDAVQTYCLFIGHARSGHSIVGALIGAHPQAVTSDELDALHYVRAGVGRRELMALTLAAARSQARGREKQGRDGAVYSYEVPDWWRDEWQSLRVVGDSLAGRTVQALQDEPALIDRVDALLDPTVVRYIHVVRDPFDNISTMIIRGERSFEGACERYFATCAALIDARARLGSERVHELTHEEFVTAPREELRRLCAYLGLESSVGYEDACAAIVFDSPSRSSSRVAWDAGMVERVRQQVSAYPFLARYLGSSPAAPLSGAAAAGPVGGPS